MLNPNRSAKSANVAAFEGWDFEPGLSAADMDAIMAMECEDSLATTYAPAEAPRDGERGLSEADWDAIMAMEAADSLATTYRPSY